MDIPENICECLRQFLQSQAANFNTIMQNVGEQRLISGNGVPPSHALSSPDMGGEMFSSSQLLTILILVAFVFFLFSMPTKKSANAVEKGLQEPSHRRDDGGNDMIR